VYFDSPVFFVFLVIVVALYWRLSRRNQNILLLIASYFFYGWWDWRFLLLMAASTTLDFFLAQKIDHTALLRQKKILLAISLIVNFGFLGIFKYFNFFTGSFLTLLGSLGVHGAPIATLKILLPPGISFYTFQEVAYIVDVYHGKLKSADSLVEYALFISLFPHLIAGPIQQPSHLLPQVQAARVMDREKFFDGQMLIVFGLLQKCVVADNCALIANAAFNGTLGKPSIPTVLLGAYAFAGQIYGDFAGYSNIARGCAQLLGFHFMINFRQPYLATSFQDFWRRWHISLSSWLRDYLYIPLGGNRKGKLRTYVNLLATMLLGGLWHGANWTFVVWGAMHGAILALERVLGINSDGDERSHSVSAWVKRIATFNLVCLSWIFFRATSLLQAMTFLRGLSIWAWQPAYANAFAFLAIFFAPVLAIDLLVEHHPGDEYMFQGSGVRARALLGLAVFAIVTLVSASDLNAFIYFQF